MGSSRIIKPQSGRVELVSPSSPIELIASFIDAGDEIFVKPCDSVGVFLEVDIGTSTNVQIRALAKHRTALQAAVDLANDLKTQLNLHYADYGSGAEEHKAAYAVVSTNYAMNFPECVALTKALLDSYDAHDTDAEGGAPTYHQATEAGDASLASVAAPTTVTLCHTRLEDLRAKLITHFADATAHSSGDNTSSVVIADKEYFLPIRSVGASDVKVEEEYLELNVDADQNLVLEVDTNGIIPYLQFQVKDAADGTGQIDSAYLTFNLRRYRGK